MKFQQYINEKLGLNNKQIIQTYGKKIIEYYNDRKNQFKGSSKIDSIATIIVDVLKNKKEPIDHLSDKDIKNIAKELSKEK